MMNQTTIDPNELAKFSSLAAEWWNPKGKFGVLHKFNPVRLEWIRHHVIQHFGRDSTSLKPCEGLRFLDIGCGGGLLSEPMARLGAEVVGVDPSEKNIKTASVHAHEQGLAIDYRAATAESLNEAGETFDVILNMEVVEHVASVPLFMEACANMVKPGGLMFVATINRTLKAYALAIIGAEYVLQWLPKGTHDYDKLVKPEELKHPLGLHGMQILDTSGVVYNPLRDRWQPSNDTSVNYMLVAGKR